MTTSPIASVVRGLSAEISRLTAARGSRVSVGKLGVIDRAGQLPLAPAGGLVSPNGACRLLRTADGWMALNLARDEDRDLVPAWLGRDVAGDPWDLIAEHAPRQSCAVLRDQAVLLGLPASIVGEASPGEPVPPMVRTREYARAAPRAAARVVDLSALWAGPLCGAILAAAGAEVTKVESTRRPDPTRLSTPEFFRRLNGRKAGLALDLAHPDGQADLRDLVMDADVVITSARPRGLASIGLDPDAILRARPGLVWVAVTGYGLAGGVWDAPCAMRVGFGDDTAAGGGLVGWTAAGEPRFLGDALSDPITGLGAAVTTLRALEQGGGCVVDAGMAPMAAYAARTCSVQVAT